MKPSPRQQVFQGRLNALLDEFAREVGPEFDGDPDESVPMQMPVAVAWVLVVDWDDVADDALSSTVSVNSGARWTHRIGMLRAAQAMTENGD